MKKSGYESEGRLNSAPKPILLVISGPSGAGKDAVLTRLKEQGFPFEFITTVTTRPRRNSERDNIDYHFVTGKVFQKMVEGEELLEWANVYGNWYGVPRQPVKQALVGGKDTIIKVDIQGAATIKNILPQAVLIFLAPLSKDDLITRLNGRNTESASDLDLRLRTAEQEIEKLSMFDYLLVNKQGQIDKVISEIKAIITAEKCRVTPRKIAL
jgi:guanylate kinase